MPKPKLSTLFLLLSLGLSLGGVVYLTLGLDAEQAKRIWTEQQLEKVTQAKEELQKERDELIQAKQALEGQLTDATTQAKTLADDLAKEKRAREALTNEIAQTRRESTDLKGRLDQERQEKLTLTEELAKAKQSYQALSNELTTLRQAKEALEKRVKEMLSSHASQMEKIVVKPSATPASNPSTGQAPSMTANEGKVLVVNREFNFVVVNLGSKDGLQVGTPLTISRAGKPVAKTQVERIYENMAAATVLVEEQKDKIQEGDSVRVVS